MRFLNAKEIRLIKEYQAKFGNDAVLKFRFSQQKGERRISLKRIVSLLELTKDVKEEYENERTTDETPSYNSISSYINLRRDDTIKRNFEIPRTLKS